jgi:peptide/nickel transport system ATP-binding protein
MRVGAQVAETLEAHGVDRAAARKRAVDLLDRVGIPDAAGRAASYPHEFSGGMRQRVVIAAALANRPELLIADEPTTALDVTVQAQILELLRELREEFDLATLFITHDLGVVAEFCDDVTVMRHGLVVEKADVSTLFTTPVEAYTRMLLDAVPRIDAAPARTIERAAAPGEADGPCAAASAGEPILRVTDLRVDVAARRAFRRSEPVYAVDGVSLEIRAGETLGLVGESGCGKSTLSRAISGLLPIASGTVRLAGHDVTDRPVGHADRRGVQYVFQDAYAALNPLRTVRQSLEEARAAIGGGEQAPETEELMRLVGLDPAALDRRPAEFSGGQRQRIGIARALAARPSLLLCDEPVSALDVSVQAQVIELLEHLRDELGLGILFIAHDLAVVKHLSDRVAVMRKGRLVEAGTVDEVYERPTHPYTVQLLQSSPLPEVGAARERILADRRGWGRS